MLLCAAGDIHGALDRLYGDVLAFEASLGARFDHLLHVGDFGIWPDPARVDRATRNHEGAGDFPRWLAERRPAPVPTPLRGSATCPTARARPCRAAGWWSRGSGDATAGRTTAGLPHRCAARRGGTTPRTRSNASAALPGLHGSRPWKQPAELRQRLSGLK